MRCYRESLGLLDGDDYLTLTSNIHVEATLLCDEVTGARHRMREPAPVLLQYLCSGVTLKNWLDICRMHNVGKNRAVGILLSLNRIAALNRKRAFFKHVLAAMHWFAIYRFGIVPLRLASRYPGTWSGLVMVVIRSSIPLVILVAVICSMIIFGAMSSVSLLGFVILWLMVLVASTIAHEWVHWKVARRYGPACFVRRGLRVGVLHATLPISQDRLSAILGPMLGLTVVLIVCGLLVILNVSTNILFLFFCIAIFQACSWLPVYGDGRVIINTWKKRYA